MGGPGWLGGEPREALGGWARAPEGGPPHGGGGGGGCSLPGGRRGPLLSEGGGWACIARCRAMSIHGRAAWDYIPNPPRRSPFLGGLRGGGGLAVVACTHPCGGGGVAGGSSVRLGRKNPVASPGLVGPFEEEPRIRRGGLRIMVWYGMVWYGMVWYGMVWYVVVVVVVGVAPSTSWREKLPDTLSLGRAQGSSRPASRWPGVCRRRPRGGGGGFRLLSGGGGGACRCERDHVPMRPWFAPPPLGEGVCTCAKRGGMGGGMEGPPVRGPAGPRFPLLPAATPPCARALARPMRAPLWAAGPAARASVGPRRGAEWGCVGAAQWRSVVRCRGAAVWGGAGAQQCGAA